MTPPKQLHKHDPANGVYGDCGRTVIACLLDLHPSDVPHFWDDGKEDATAAEDCRKWLAERGLRIITWALDGRLMEVLAYMKCFNPGTYYTLMGTSPRQVNHVVICHDDEIVCDPSLEGGGLVGPSDDGHWWVDVLVRDLLNGPAAA